MKTFIGFGVGSGANILSRYEVIIHLQWVCENLEYSVQSLDGRYYTLQFVDGGLSGFGLAWYWYNVIQCFPWACWMSKSQKLQIFHSIRTITADDVSTIENTAVYKIYTLFYFSISNDHVQGSQCIDTCIDANCIETRVYFITFDE